MDTIFYRKHYWNSLFYGAEAQGYSLIMADTNNIYLGNNTNGRYLNDSLARILLTSIKIDGTVNWSYRIGGDASYVVYQMATMPNGDCLAVIYRAVPVNTSFGYTHDVYYIRIDTAGNIFNTTSPTSSPLIIEADNFTVYPNPASDVVHVSTTLKSDMLKIRFYDFTGKEVVSENINSSQTELNVRSFPNGMYYYQIEENGRSIYSGKLLKI